MRSDAHAAMLHTESCKLCLDQTQLCCCQGLCYARQTRLVLWQYSSCQEVRGELYLIEDQTADYAAIQASASYDVH